MAKGGQPDQMKSLKKSNDNLKKQLENARKDIKRLEDRVEVQEHASKEQNGGSSREVQLETERSLNWLHESESDIQRANRFLSSCNSTVSPVHGTLISLAMDFQV